MIDGHPNPNSLCAAVAARYADSAGAEADVRRLTLRDLDFDPNFLGGERAGQVLEPDPVRARKAIEAANHVVIVAPIWWGSVPALLKGFIDRVFEAGWSYRYVPLGYPVGHLKGRTARLIQTTDAPWWYLRWIDRDPSKRHIAHGLLKFSGLKPVSLTRLGPVRTSNAKKRAAWLDQVARIAAEDARRASDTPPPPVHVRQGTKK